ncbi:MAG: HAMP domain-containing sensor histidine kinase [Thermodesulfovibrionales bacterium]|jgi:signal transduction histidine kinase|nr:HAMP domain-containing sensor histidine kinase [Thermodesulfovibrionales bacterium]
MVLAQDNSLHVGKLITSNECVPPSTAVRYVTDKFFNSAQMDAVALVEGREPVGLVTRPKFLFTLFRRYGFELYERKPIITIADVEPLMIYEGEKLDVAINKALNRPARDIYDEVIVVDDNWHYKGLLSVKQMIMQQSNTLANSIVQKKMASERAKELEKINHVKSQFIANVTHELRSPVNAIIGLAELMRISCEKGYVDQLRDRLSLLMSSATNLRAIITNILDLSKIEAGKMEVIYERFDIAAMLREVAETTQVLIGNKPVDVEATTQDNPVFIISDPVKVRQILINLTNNAAKFTDKGKIILTLRTRNNGIKITVSDTGIGIKESDLSKLFTAFSQLEDAKTKRYEGTGLGLTITKNLLNLLGGSISVSSKFGKGTSFEVYLPSRQSKKQEEIYGKD